MTDQPTKQQDEQQPPVETAAEHAPEATSDACLLAELAIDDAAAAQNLDAATVEKLKGLCRSLCNGEKQDEAIATLLAGINHDHDVSMAEHEGYIRGKNEKIAATHHFDSDATSKATRHSITPNFAHRSIWDIE